MFCPRCGKERLPEQKFCRFCGAVLPAVQGAPSAAASVPAAPAAPPAPSAPVAPAAPATSTAPVAAQTPAVPQSTAGSLHAIPDGGLTIEDVSGWLQSAGYSAKVVTSESGKRHIVSSTQGTTFNIFMGDCKGERCASIELAAGFTTNGTFDISQINDWNSNNRWCRAYYDSVNDPWLEMDVDLYPGGTYESLNDQFGAWNNTLGRFMSKYKIK
jgi:hypothetical protein